MPSIFRAATAAIPLAVSAILSSPALFAQSEQPILPNELSSAEPLNYAADRLIPFLKGEIAAEEFLTDSFLKAVPSPQLKAITDDLIRQHGAPLSLIQIKRTSPTTGEYSLQMERASAQVNLTVDPVSRKLFGLFFTGIRQNGDNIEQIRSEFAALPGQTAFAIAELSDTAAPKIIASHNPTSQIAIASTFKLYILAELSAQIRSGQRKWNDVAPLSHRSYSSLATRGWPLNSPVTLDTSPANDRDERQ